MKKTLAVLVLCLLTTACAQAIPATTNPDAAGLWSGIWHGLILPFAFVISLFNSDVGIYEAVNTGFSYNLGFFLGVAILFGTASNT